MSLALFSPMASISSHNAWKNLSPASVFSSRGSHNSALCASIISKTCTCSYEKDDGCASQATKRLGFLHPVFSPERLQVTVRAFKKQNTLCQSLPAEVHDNAVPSNVESSHSQAVNVLTTVLSPFQTFPWDKVQARLMQRLADILWKMGKWIGLPLLVIMACSDAVSTILAGKELFVPIGLLAGIVLAGIWKETAIALGKDFQDGIIPWHLVGPIVLFALTKFISPKNPMWARAFLLHFANGGLWQTIRLVIDWRRCKTEISTAEAHTLELSQK